MSGKKWIVGALIAVVVVGALIAVGFAVYRIGFMQGAMFANTGEGIPLPFHGRHGFLPGDRGEVPEQLQGRFDFSMRDFDQGYHPGSGFPGQRPFFSPFSLILRVAFLGVVIWLLYKLVTKVFRGNGNGWQLTYQKLPADTTLSEPELKKVDQPEQEEEGGGNFTNSEG